MFIRNLRILNFRNLACVDINPSVGFNVLTGQNAQGKTNTAEAIMLCLSAKSHRENITENFIGPNDVSAQITAETTLDNGTEATAKLTISNVRSHYIDDEAIRSRTRLVSTFPVVFFSPEDLKIVKEAPIIRRNFLNEASAQIYPPYVNLISEYARILKQRNTLLKDYSPSSEPMLEVYDESLINCAVDIARVRIKFLSMCEKTASEYYRFISDEKENISLNYVSNVLNEAGITDIRRAFEIAIKESRKEDILTRTTTKGIHHDDIAIFISGKPARKFASQGQSRSIAICLKLSLCDLIKQRRDCEAIVILDDVMSELDIVRRGKIIELLKDKQVFITCAIQDFDINNYENKIFYVENGVVSPLQTGRD